MRPAQDDGTIMLRQESKSPARCSGRAQIISFNFVNAATRALCQASALNTAPARCTGADELRARLGQIAWAQPDQS
jgi:hypothetical protein